MVHYSSLADRRKWMALRRAILRATYGTDRGETLIAAIVRAVLGR